MNSEYNEQMLNRDKAIKAGNDLIDCLKKATPEFRKLINDDMMGLLFVKVRDNEELNNALKQFMELKTDGNFMRIM